MVKIQKTSYIFYDFNGKIHSMYKVCFCLIAVDLLANEENY